MSFTDRVLRKCKHNKKLHYFIEYDKIQNFIYQNHFFVDETDK